jgi:hypothetical protein
MRPANAEFVEMVFERVRRRGEADLELRGKRRTAVVARERRRDHLVARDEIREHRPPVVPGAREAVDQDDLLARSRPVQGCRELRHGTAAYRFG